MWVLSLWLYVIIALFFFHKDELRDVFKHQFSLAYLSYSSVNKSGIKKIYKYLILMLKSEETALFPTSFQLKSNLKWTLLFFVLQFVFFSGKYLCSGFNILLNLQKQNQFLFFLFFRPLGTIIFEEHSKLAFGC